MPNQHAAYSARKGHLVSLETTDREAAIDAAKAINDRLEMESSPPTDRSFFKEHIDDTNNRSIAETRPYIGDFAVSVVRANPYEIKALSTDKPVYLLKVGTRNAAAEIPEYRGVERLQQAFVDSTSELLK